MLDEFLLPSLVSRVTVTSVIVTSRQQVCDGAWFEVVRFVPGMGSCAAS
jgi:hypothetical protein